MNRYKVSREIKDVGFYIDVQHTHRYINMKRYSLLVTCVREGVVGRPREAQGGRRPSAFESMASRNLVCFLAGTHGGSDGVVSVDQKDKVQQRQQH